MTTKIKGAAVSPDEPDANPPMPATLDAVRVFRDTLYTSRVLILPQCSGTLRVTKGQVSVASNDNAAIGYLEGRVDFIAVEG
ncbi:hypothetical protein [Pseudomonas sp. B28(2017)]|uniref:hypothetical protein n=1 Tax=Pseudomonas sp. B28(2017) TaxID=1981730 RepID=UPI000A1E6F95|nr:hypothetical protein [Pseudomonas sp. B28(2017)]